MNERNISAPQDNSVPELDDFMLAMSREQTKDIDPNLVPIFVSGMWELSGITSSHSAGTSLWVR